jgi:zinc transporter 5/7
MASTYALPITPTSHTHSHERSRSQYSPYSNGVTNPSPLREEAHRHYNAELGGNGQLYGAVRSPYAEYNGHAHEHNHDRSGSTDSTWTLKAFANGRPKARPRGESDLGRSPQAKNATVAKYGFSPVSPIQEVAPAVPSESFVPSS